MVTPSKYLSKNNKLWWKTYCSCKSHILYYILYIAFFTDNTLLFHELAHLNISLFAKIMSLPANPCPNLNLELEFAYNQSIPTCKFLSVQKHLLTSEFDLFVGV